MRLFGIRATSVTTGLGLVAASLGVLGAGSNGPGSTKYEVTAPLLSVGEEPVYACGGFILHTLTGCAGIVVHGVDVGQIPGVESYPWGSRLTPPVRLVGTWDGRALTLTQSPQSAV